MRTRIGKSGKDRLLDAVRKGGIKNILMARCQKIGDMLTFMPALLCARDYFPSARITLLCHRDGLPVAGRIPFVNIMLAEDVKKKRLRTKEPFDLLITSSQDAGWIKLKKRFNIKYAVGVLPDNMKGVCLKHRWQFRYFDSVDRYNESEHDVRRNLKTLRLLGRDGCGSVDRSLWITTSEREKVSTLLDGITPPLVVISPCASRPSKNWPSRYFASLCDKLISETNVHIVFAGEGGLAERQTGEIISAMNEKALSLVNRTSFGEFAALIERADLLISVDSGPAHIASYLNRPLIVLIGPGDYDQWKPWHKDKALGKALRAYCKCGTTLYECAEKRHCLESIMPEEVFEAAVNVLGTPHAEDG